MTVKEIAIHTIEELPEEASLAGIQERINFVAGIRKGLRELDEGKGIPHYRVREELAEWLRTDLVACRPRRLERDLCLHRRRRFRRSKEIHPKSIHGC
jgi:hypothetical protein